jgi:hypothetical protein
LVVLIPRVAWEFIFNLVVYSVSFTIKLTGSPADNPFSLSSDIFIMVIVVLYFQIKPVKAYT